MKKFYFTFLTLLLVAQSCLHSFQYDLAIGAIFQNEARFIKEWIEYHQKVGVEHFILYNNNSNDNYIEILEPYINSGTVELIDWNSRKETNDWSHFSFEVQPGAYTDAVNRSKHVSRWLALIDIDEFIVPVIEDNIVDVLDKYYGNVSGLCVNWQHFGTSHIEEVPKDQMLKHLTWKLQWNHFKNITYKSIVNPLHVEKCTHPHFCLYKPTHWHVNTNYEKIDVCNNGVYIDKIQLNHYWVKDEKFLREEKIPRYESWGVNKDCILKQVEEMNFEQDFKIQRFIN
jgi:hypothetical protein